MSAGCSGYSKAHSFPACQNQSLFGNSLEQPNKCMEDKNEGKQLIDKLIKKRKQENVAFTKLLNAIENKSQIDEKTGVKRKNKT